MFDLFNRLMSSKKRVIPKRQLEILKSLLEVDHLRLEKLVQNLSEPYRELKNPRKALIRDLDYLLHLDAIHVLKTEDGHFDFKVNLDWPTQITETSFYEKTRQLPKARTHSFLM